MEWFVILVVVVVVAGTGWWVHRRRGTSHGAGGHRVVAPGEVSDPRIGFRKEL